MCLICHLTQFSLCIVSVAPLGNIWESFGLQFKFMCDNTNRLLSKRQAKDFDQILHPKYLCKAYLFVRSGRRGVRDGKMPGVDKICAEVMRAFGYQGVMADPFLK